MLNIWTLINDFHKNQKNDFDSNSQSLKKSKNQI